MSKDNTSVIVWGITGALALCMLGAAVYISMNNRAAQTETTATPPASITVKQEPPVTKVPQEQSRPERAQPERVQQPAPSKQAERRTEPETQTEEPAPVQRAAADEEVTLDLSRIAGNMSAGTKLVGNESEKFPLRHTCYRHNFSPAVTIERAPAAARSFAVFLEKTNENEDNVLHWALFNIPPDTKTLAENVPKQPEYNGMRHAANDFGNAEYAGPCEPKGRQNYRLRVFALDRELSQPASVARQELVRAMNGHIIDMAEIDFIHYNKL